MSHDNDRPGACHTACAVLPEYSAASAATLCKLLTNGHKPLLLGVWAPVRATKCAVRRVRRTAKGA